jgi:exopolysaccharide biosynthesis polyprenyl glycosylphosphotransferase
LRNPYATSGTHGPDRSETDADRLIDLTIAEGDIEYAIADRPPIVPTGISAARHFRLISFVLVLIDVLCLTTALLAAHALRFGSLPASDYLVGTLAAAVLWIGVFYALGLYATQRLSRLEEFRRTISAVGIGVVVVILLTFWFDVYLSRSWMAFTLIIALMLELIGRGGVRHYVDRRQASQSLVQRTLILGTGESAAELMGDLGRPGSGFLPVGRIDVTRPPISSPEMSSADRLLRIRAIFRGYDLDCVFVASPTIGAQQIVAVTQAARLEGIVVRVYTHMPGILPSRLTVQHVGRDGIALTLKPTGLSAGQRIVKRGMDLVLSCVGLVVVCPVMLGVALAIKVTSAGPVLFRQERVTEGGRTFRMYKFRTMTVEGHDKHGASPIDASVPFFKLRSDPRLTPLGRRLRRWSLDELPQLLNVLRGEMSLVGPRPLPTEQVSANVELLAPRHEVRAGITGWWQIQGRSTLGPEEAIQLDQVYIENWSPALDLYILFRTMGVLIKRDGAF